MTIKEMRETLGDTQKSFAERYEIPKRSIENWEGGKSDPPPYLVKLLERAVKEDAIK